MLTEEEKTRLAYHATASFANTKHVPHGFVEYSIEASAAYLGLSLTPGDIDEIAARVGSALAILFRL
jgi:hypothetical protein